SRATATRGPPSCSSTSTRARPASGARPIRSSAPRRRSARKGCPRRWRGDSRAGNEPWVSRAAALAFGVCLLAAGCGGRAVSSPPPGLPRPLAHGLAGASDSVASALAAGDGCTALHRATALQRTVIAAVNARRVPPAFQEPLLGAVNSL